MPERSGRYSVKGLEEGEFEPGSRNRVLKNLLGIKTRREINIVERQELGRAQNLLVNLYDKEHRFTTADICKIHKLWLKDIYSWAGCYRQVNMSKDGFPFAAVSQIPKLMEKFEKEQLKKFTPCCFAELEDIALAISIIHSELVLIHPFREGNGRAARLLANLMALQANLPPLNFRSFTGEGRKKYISAIQIAVGHSYEPIKEMFKTVIEETLRYYQK